MENPGSKQTFEEFYRASYALLKRYVMRIGARPDEADDVVQEAMVQAFQKWAKLEFPLAWVKKAANTELTKAINRRQREALLLRAMGRDNTVDEPSSHDLEQVRAALRSLPEAQREAFAYTYDDFKPSEIADFIDKSPATVRANLREARKRLRQVLGSVETPERRGNNRREQT